MNTVLIVDDDPDILDTVGFLLEDAGYRVVTALDGKTMFKGLDKEFPDLVILDVRRPKSIQKDISRMRF